MQNHYLVGCALLVVFIAQVSESYEDVQRPVEFVGPTRIRQSNSGPFIEQRPFGEDSDKRRRSKNGSFCNVSTDCKSGCCVYGSDRSHRCSAMTTFKERCNTSQVKGGAYMEFCPCKFGESLCVKSKQSNHYRCRA